MIFGINTTCDISKLSQIYNNFEISLVVFMPNITTNHAITYTNSLDAFQNNYIKGKQGRTAKRKCDFIAAKPIGNAEVYQLRTR